MMFLSGREPLNTLKTREGARNRFDLRCLEAFTVPRWRERVSMLCTALGTKGPSSVTVTWRPGHLILVIS